MYAFRNLALWLAHGTIAPRVYQASDEGGQHELKVSPEYLVYTQYQEHPAQFGSTWGGFYILEGNTLSVKLEFNSAFAENGLRTVRCR